MKVSKRTTIIALILTASFFAFTLFHASWLADAPTGKPKLVAARGVVPVRGPDGCAALANAGFGGTVVGPDVAALQMAIGSNAQAVQVSTELQGGSIVITHQFEPGCPADAALPQATVSEALGALTRPELFWRVDNARQAAALTSAIPQNERAIFFGGARALQSLRENRTNPPPLDILAARRCVADYRTVGMTGRLPRACLDGWALLTLDDLGFTLWGWPNRFLDRMAKADVRVIIAQSVEGDRIKGLTDVRQYGEIANGFNGYIWIDKIEELGPALRR